jgi:hypothetical protein
MSRFPPIPSFRATAVVTIALSAIVAACGAPPRPGQGLLVVTNGAIGVTDASWSLVAFDGPRDRIAAVSASHGDVVAATANGTFLWSPDGPGPRTWTAIAVPRTDPITVPLIALSPGGTQLAIAAGDLQGSTFHVIVVDLAAGTSRSMPVARGLNGRPAWIGPDLLAIDVIKPNGESGIAGVDALTGALTDDVFSGTSVSASDDRRHVALDDPATGDVLAGDLDERVLGAPQRATRLGGPAGSAVEALLMSGDGSRLAVVRRSEEGISSVEIYALVSDRWAQARIIELAGDGRVSVAWLR